MTTFFDIESGGFKNREMVVMMGRRTGKTTALQEFTNSHTPFKIVDEAIVDGQQWYTMGTPRSDIASWIRTQHKDLWTEQSTNWALYAYFDIHEKLRIMMELKFR